MKRNGEHLGKRSLVEMKIHRKKIEGYFTVEAAMVLPIVIAVILMIIYMWFFQYNRCLMEQDTAILALRGSILQAEEKEEVFSFVQAQYQERNKEKYRKYCFYICDYCSVFFVKLVH